jgi:hypothetical protein
MRRLLLASAALLAASLVSGATVLYVDCDHGHDTPGGGTSPATALRTPNYARDLVRGKAPATVEIVGDCYPGNASSPVPDFSQVGGRAHGVDKCMRQCVCACGRVWRVRGCERDAFGRACSRRMIVPICPFPVNGRPGCPDVDLR